LNYWEKVKPKDLVYNTKNKVELKKEDLTKLDNNKVMQAVYYYYNMTLSYGPMFLGWPSSNEINKDKFNRRIKKIEQIKLHKEYYELYKKFGFIKFVEITDYNKSQANLVQQFEKLLDNFLPQNGKKR
jgi:hypothetical protein